MPGEIAVRGPNVFYEYWGNEAATREALHDGWYRTGDIGLRDTDGYFWIHDRKKNLIISGGENIYPAEVERVLLEHPDVIECGVIGRLDPRWDEVPVAYVIKRAGSPVRHRRLEDSCRKATGPVQGSARDRLCRRPAADGAGQGPTFHAEALGFDRSGRCDLKIAVLGGGNGSFAAAADFTLQGHDVRLWRRDAEPGGSASRCRITHHSSRMSMADTMFRSRWSPQISVRLSPAPS